MRAHFFETQCSYSTGSYSMPSAVKSSVLSNSVVLVSSCLRIKEPHLTGATYSQEICTKNLYQKLAPNRTQLYSVQVSGTRHFQTQPTNQTAQFWSHASVQVSCTNFLRMFHPYQVSRFVLFSSMTLLMFADVLSDNLRKQKTNIIHVRCNSNNFPNKSDSEQLSASENSHRAEF